MVVYIVHGVSPSLRGEMSRWLIQPQVGIFVGHLSARVRDLLWSRIQKTARKGSAVLVYTDKNEQGFMIRTYGKTPKLIVDYEGLLLPKTPISE